MAAIGDGWETDAWIEAGWVTGAWLVGAAAIVLQFLRPLRGLEVVTVGAVSNPRLYFRLVSGVTRTHIYRKGPMSPNALLTKV